MKIIILGWHPVGLVVQDKDFKQHHNQGPYSQKILVLRIAPSNNILRKLLEMWVFQLKKRS